MRSLILSVAVLTAGILPLAAPNVTHGIDDPNIRPASRITIDDPNIRPNPILRTIATANTTQR